ncbi:MAG TPA: archaea-specific SMC-related protein, partial [Halobacteriales archaeon]|nr:archaea-specific SMC-related protein [Halobacteriales archaeon]
MEPTQTAAGNAAVHVENVGGIVEADVELEPGVNVLAGRNATNRTSFLRALMAALGSDDVAIRGDAEAGSVELTVDGETYTRHLRRGDGVVATGEPYLGDSTAADCFAFLLEANDARRAVATGGDLREVLMRPVDTGAIEDEIASLEDEKREVDRQLEERSALEDDLEELQAERERLGSEIESTREELAETEAEIEATDADLAESREEKQELDEKLAELQDRRRERETVRYRIESQRETVERLREERATVEDRLEDAGGEPGEDLDDLEARVAELRERKRDLEATINQLQGIIQFNQEMLDGEGAVDLESIVAGDGDATAPVTEGLLGDDGSLVCWT